MDKLLIQDLVKGYSIETTVREAARVKSFADLVPAGTRLYVVHVPGTDFEDTVALARRLRNEGVEPVPHVVARHIASLATLDDFFARLSGDAGVRQVLVVAGDKAQPAGEIESSLQILESGLLEKHRITTVGVAGHPEGHPDLGEAVLRDALKRKNAYARKSGAKVYIVTQFVFTADPVIRWESQYAGDIDALPVTVGLPGLATVPTLLRYAKDCGVGPSIQALTKRAASLTRLLTVSMPDDILVALAEHKARNPQSRIRNIHFFPFGGFKRTADWANNIVAGRFEMMGNGLRATL